MNARHLLDSSLSIVCPHCGNEDEDDLEVIPNDSLQFMRCAECGADFHFAVMECRACAAEALFSWSQPPAENAAIDLKCPACGRRYVDHEVLESATMLDL